MRTERSAEVGLDSEIGNAANRLEHRLVAILAHELRNPLASIMLALHALRERHTDEPMDRHARDAAERQARHMARIIEEVLDLCSARQNKLSLCRERVSAFSCGPGTGSQFVVRLLDCAPNVQEGRALSRPENGASLAATGR